MVFVCNDKYHYNIKLLETYGNKNIATLTIRLDEKLKKDAYAELEKLNVTPSEAIRLTFQYIIENKRLPVKNITISDI